MNDEARKAEATKAPAEIEFRGHKFLVPREYEEWSIDFLESIEENKSAGIARGALGPDQWRVVRSMNLKVRDLNELAGKITTALGFKSGESAPSSD